MMIYSILLLSCFFIFELLYFKLADRFSIIDKPNERSSHTLNTIRGGGIIFPIAWLCYFVISQGQFPWFTAGLLLIAVVSFWDDIRSLHHILRLLAHLIAFALCFYELGLWTDLPVWAMILLFIGSIGALNVVNFMDGINGMTGMYALSVLLPVLWFYDGFLSLQNPWWIIVLSIIVFGYFNFRKKARCFAGDVGSISLGFMLIFLVLGLIFDRWASDFPSLDVKNDVTNFDFKYILLLSIYGVDGVLTIIQRLIAKENIFRAHRQHLYQLLANEKQWPHLKVSLLYACLQFMISVWVMFFTVNLYQAIGMIVVLCCLYITVKKAFNTTILI